MTPKTHPYTLMRPVTWTPIGHADTEDGAIEAAVTEARESGRAVQVMYAFTQIPIATVHPGGKIERSIYA